jgi:hypothetical protein
MIILSEKKQEVTAEEGRQAGLKFASEQLIHYTPESSREQLGDWFSPDAWCDQKLVWLVPLRTTLEELDMLSAYNQARDEAIKASSQYAQAWERYEEWANKNQPFYVFAQHLGEGASEVEVQAMVKALQRRGWDAQYPEGIKYRAWFYFPEIPKEVWERCAAEARKLRRVDY